MYKITLSIFLLFLIFSSCTKEAERGDIFECSIDGVKHQFTNLNAYATYDASGGAYSIYGTDVLENMNNPETIYLSLDADLDPGTYTLGRGEDGNGYYTDQNESFLFTTVPKGGTGTLVISSKNAESVKGTFNFHGIDLDSNESIDVVSGSFDVSFR